jgi:hypothetical protein
MIHEIERGARREEDAGAEYPCSDTWKGNRAGWIKHIEKATDSTAKLPFQWRKPPLAHLLLQTRKCMSTIEDTQNERERRDSMAHSWCTA